MNYRWTINREFSGKNVVFRFFFKFKNINIGRDHILTETNGLCLLKAVKESKETLRNIKD